MAETKVIFTENYKQLINQNVIDLISDKNSVNVYMALGHVAHWSEETAEFSPDEFIQTPQQSVDYFNEVHRNLVAMKKITGSHLSLVVERIDWTADTVYEQYSNTVDHFTTTTNLVQTGTITTTGTDVTGSNTQFDAYLAVGDKIRPDGGGSIAIPETREVINIHNATALTVNTAFQNTYTDNVFYRHVETAPFRTSKFYVRNSKDQVFKCLDNNHGAPSTFEPMLSIGGTLPQSTYFQTDDGYKWKYLYTIDASAKRKFLTKDWMPVKANPTIREAAQPGSIDIIHILSGGAGYNENVPSANSPIVSVIGDGSDCQLSAKINDSGEIYDINILSGGKGYTTASVIVDASHGGSGAQLLPVIGPRGGHGNDPVEELGSPALMISVDFSGDENETLPPINAETGESNFDFHQIVLLKNPIDVNGTLAANTNYGLCTRIIMQGVIGDYELDEIVYQGPNYANATFEARVVDWDAAKASLYVNNLKGTFSETGLLRARTSGINAVANDKFDPDIVPFSAQILFINNTKGIYREAQKTDQIRIILTSNNPK